MTDDHIDPDDIARLAAAAEKLAAGPDPVSMVGQAVTAGPTPEWVGRHAELTDQERQLDTRGQALPEAEYAELRRLDRRMASDEGQAYRTPPPPVLPPSVGWASLPELRPDQATAAAAVAAGKAGVPASDLPPPIPTQPPADRPDDARPGPDRGGGLAAADTAVVDLLAGVRAGVDKLVELALQAGGSGAPPGQPDRRSEKEDHRGRPGEPDRRPRGRLGRAVDRVKDSKVGRGVRAFGRGFRTGRGLGRVPGPGGVPGGAGAGLPKVPAPGGLGLGGGAGGGAAGGAAGGMGALGVAGGVAGAVVALGVAAYKAGETIREMAGEQEQYIRSLAEVSPDQAAGVAELDANRLLRQMAMGEGTAESATAMLESIDRFEEATAPFNVALENFKNEALTQLMDIVSTVVEAGESLVRGLENFLNNLPGVDGVKLLPDKEEKDKEESVSLFGDFLDRTYADLERKAAAGREALTATRRHHDRR